MKLTAPSAPCSSATSGPSTWVHWNATLPASSGSASVAVATSETVLPSAAVVGGFATVVTGARFTFVNIAEV